MSRIGFMHFVDEIKWTIDMMLHPDKRTKKRMDIGEALVFYYKLALVPLIISLVLGFIVGAVAGTLFSTLLGYFAFLGAIGILTIVMVFILLYFIVLVPVGFFINAAIIHFFGKFVFRQFKSDYSGTFTAVVYGAAPTILFWWLGIIPVIGVLYFIIEIWAIIVEIFALANQQKTSKLAALGVIVGIVVVVIVLILILLALFLLAKL